MPPASQHDFRALAESACYGLRTVAVSNLLGEGLPAWACNSPNTQESWQCQNWGPMEPARPSCWGQQLTAGPRRDGRCSCPPPPRCSLVPILTSMPLAPFSTMGGGLGALESWITLRGLGRSKLGAKWGSRQRAFVCACGRRRWRPSKQWIPECVPGLGH